jgi:branched-chain amino acid transport system substrate-binding protein
MKSLSIASVTLALCSTALLVQPASAQETLKLGMSAVLSGPGAPWGVGAVWAGQQAVKKINDEGGIKVGGKTYKLEIIAYDNKYTAAEGARVAHTLINRDEVKFIAFSMATASVSAMQAVSEKAGVLSFTAAWGNRLRGPNFPLTFAQANTAAEIIPALYKYVKGLHPEVKTVAMINPNDASGQDVEKLAKENWEKLGVKVVSSDWFERSTTDFAPIVTKLIAQKPDMIDLAATPLGVAGLVLAELKVQGWNGIKIAAPGSSAAAIVKTGGAAAEGAYAGLSADFASTEATALQRDLNERAIKELGNPLDQVTISTWDSIMALKRAMEICDCVDPMKVAKTLPKITFESSYGPASFGGEKEYGTPSQILLPVIVTQIRNGKAIEIKRLSSPELLARDKKM